jgi:hypothetical protein
MPLGQLEGVLQIVGLGQGLGEQGVAKVGEVGFFRAAKRHAVGAGGGHDQGVFILERRDETAGVAGGNHDDFVAVFQRRHHRRQFVARQVGQLHAWLVEHQLMFMGAVAGQVDKHQIFGAGALGQGLHGAAQAFAGRHRAVGDMVAVVDQADLPAGAEAAAQ